MQGGLTWPRVLPNRCGATAGVYQGGCAARIMPMPPFYVHLQVGIVEYAIAFGGVAATRFRRNL